MSGGEREPSLVRRLVEHASAPAWAHDAAGTLLHASPAWRAAAPPPARTLPQAWLALLPPYDLVRHLAAFGAALRARAPYAFAHRLAGRPADEWYLTQAVPAGAGDALLWLGTTVAQPHTGPPRVGAALPHGGPALPCTPGLRLEVLADLDAAAGGAWYDAFGLPAGRLLLSVGQLLPGERTPGQAPALVRDAIRGALLAGAAPDLALAAAGTVLAQAEPGRSATALVALYDPRTGLLHHATAAHPPALLQDGGETVALAAVPGPALGQPAGSQAEAPPRPGVRPATGAEVRTARLGPGAVLGLRAGGPLGGGSVTLLLSRDLDGPGRA